MSHATFVVLLLLGVNAVILVLERVSPKYPLPYSERWYRRLGLAYLLLIPVILIGEVTWNVIFSNWSLMSLGESFNPWLGGLLAYFLWTGAFYWLHRWQHQNSTLWRCLHQLHHSPKRIEALTSYFVHPLGYASGSILAAFIGIFFLGLNRDGMLVFLFFGVTAAVIIHANIHLPRWWGFIMQTPDMHRVHHEYQEHRYNYSDFVIWDMLFGTYRNPKAPVLRCGFDDDKESRFTDMLRCRDVHLQP